MHFKLKNGTKIRSQREQKHFFSSCYLYLLPCLPKEGKNGYMWMDECVIILGFQRTLSSSRCSDETARSFLARSFVRSFVRVRRCPRRISKKYPRLKCNDSIFDKTWEEGSLAITAIEKDFQVEIWGWPKAIQATWGLLSYNNEPSFVYVRQRMAARSNDSLIETSVIIVPGRTELASVQGNGKHA